MSFDAWWLYGICAIVQVHGVHEYHTLTKHTHTLAYTLWYDICICVCVSESAEHICSFDLTNPSLFLLYGELVAHSGNYNGWVLAELFVVLR